jgi:hypothetical protein
MTGRRKVLLWIFILLYLFFGLFATAFILQIPWHLAFGWISFLIANAPKMKVSGASLVSAVILLVLLLIGLQLFLSQGAANTNLRRWHWRWTFSILGLVILMFAAGISAAGVVHQLGWLLTGPDRMLRNKFSNHLTSRLNLQSMGKAFHEITEEDGHFPPGALFAENGQALHSWETLLLPHLVTDSWREKPSIRIDVDLTKPWTDPVNAVAFRKKLPVFLNPPLGPDEVDGLAASHYAWNSHLLGIPTPLKASDIKDGLSNTLLIGEVNTAHRAWSDPINWRDPALGLHSRPDTFGGVPEEGYVHFLLLDGSCRTLSTNIDKEVLKALATPAGREAVPEF